MTLNFPFIPTKRRLGDADGIDSFAFSETEKIKVIGKGPLPSAILPKHSEEEGFLKEILCKHWDEEGSKVIKKVKILTTAYQYINFLDLTGALYAQR